MKTIKNIIQLLKKKPHWFLLLLGAVFFCLYAWLYLSTPLIFNSPDEAATFVFAQNFAEQGSLKIEMGENPGNRMLPRSVNIIGSHWVPGSFIGLILFLGMIQKLFGQGLMMVTPSLFAVFGVFAFYGILRRIFTERIAFLSSILFFFLPQWWHFASKGFLPNTTFLSLLLISLYLAMKAHELMKKQWYHYLSFGLLSGLSFGLAFSIRPSAFWWLLVMIVTLLIAQRKYLKWPILLMGILGVGIIGVWNGYWQIDTYGSFLNTGYDQYQFGLEPLSNSLARSSLFSPFPLGIDLVSTFRNIANFTFKLFWWQVILLLIGLMAWWKQKGCSKEQKLYTSLVLFMTFYLIIYYGSWSVADDLDGTRVSIAFSHVRYWLPIMIGFLPFVVLGMMRVVRRLKKPNRLLGWNILLGVVLLLSIYSVLASKDNLREIAQNIVNYKEIRQEVVELTEANAVIVSERSDKVFWPARNVINYQGQDYTFLVDVPRLLQIRPVYWYTILPDDHVRIWEETVFYERGLSLERIDAQGIKLYKIIQSS